MANGIYPEFLYPFVIIDGFFNSVVEFHFRPVTASLPTNGAADRAAYQ
jgi:hypothetical protein